MTPRAEIAWMVATAPLAIAIVLGHIAAVVIPRGVARMAGLMLGAALSIYYNRKRWSRG